MNLRGQRNISHAIAEVLEKRCLLSATAEIIDGTLVITGTKASDNISIWGGETFFGVLMNGEHREFARDSVDRIRVYGGTGRDYLKATQADHSVVIVGGPGNDVLWGSNRNDTLIGEDGDDVIHADAGDDRVLGKAGEDTLRGDAGADSLSGGDDADFVDGEAGDDMLLGGAAFDEIRTQSGDDDVVDAGSDGAHVLVSDEDPEPTRGAATAELVDGVLVVQVTGGELNQVMTWFGRRFISVRINDDLVRDFDADEVGALRIVGGAGEEEVTTMMPAPARVQIRFYGGDGDDRYYGHHHSATVYGEGGNDSLRAGPGGNHLVGGAGDDTISGSGGNDLIKGGGGNDTLLGDSGTLTSGNDTIFGGPGDDHIEGGGGKDSLFGDDGNDLIYDNEQTGPYGTRPDDRIEGGTGDDTIYAFGGDDTLWGGAGIDELYGGDDDDTLRGDIDDTVLDGGAGNNVIRTD